MSFPLVPPSGRTCCNFSISPFPESPCSSSERTSSDLSHQCRGSVLTRPPHPGSSGAGRLPPPLPHCSSRPARLRHNKPASPQQQQQVAMTPALPSLAPPPPTRPPPPPIIIKEENLPSEEELMEIVSLEEKQKEEVRPFSHLQVDMLSDDTTPPTPRLPLSSLVLVTPLRFLLPGSGPRAPPHHCGESAPRPSWRSGSEVSRLQGRGEWRGRSRSQ